VVDDGEPHSAAGKRIATGFVNAVLRSTLRQRHKLPMPSRPSDPSNRGAARAYLGVTCSHPDWLVTRWLDRVGFDAAETWVRFNNDSAPLTLAVNRLRTTREELRATLGLEGIEAEDARFAPDGLYVVSGNPLRRRGDGLFLVQDEASQLVPLAVDARPGERTLDRAPQQKTVIMAGDMRHRGAVRVMRARRVAPSTRSVGASTCIRFTWERTDRFPSRPHSIECWWTRRARASAPCGATLISSGADARTSWPGWPSAS
jgi:16S rRNA (cytosine967-C5)-methyltransferase